MNEKLKEAIELFEEIMIYGTEHVIRTVDVNVWKEYSPEQIQALKILSAHGPLSNTKLAEIQGVHKSAVSTRLKKLEEKGLVVSAKNSGDQRAKVVQITEEGSRILRTSDEAIYESIENLFADKIDENEIDAFVDTFRKLKDILQMKGM